jgi:hypothetical protein
MGGGAGARRRCVAEAPPQKHESGVNRYLAAVPTLPVRLRQAEPCRFRESVGPLGAEAALTAPPSRRSGSARDGTIHAGLKWIVAVQTRDAYDPCVRLRLDSPEVAGAELESVGPRGARRGYRRRPRGLPPKGVGYA